MNLSDQISANKQCTDRMLSEYEVSIVPCASIESMSFLCIVLTDGNCIIPRQQSFKRIILHTIVVFMDRNHIIHIGLMGLFIVRLSFVQIYHDAVRLLPGNRITNHLELIVIVSFSYRFNRGIRWIGNAFRNVNQFNSNGFFVAGEHLPTDHMLIRNRDIDQRVSFLWRHRGRVTDFDKTVVIGITGLMMDLHANIRIIAKIILCNTFFIDLQTNKIVEIVGNLQFDSMLSFAGFTLDKGISGGCIIIKLGRINRVIPAFDILYRVNQTGRICIITFCIDFHRVS